MVRIPVSPILVSLSLSRSLTLSIHALLLSVSGNPSVVQTHHQIPIVASRLLRHGCIEILMIVRVSSTQALPHWHSSRTGQSASTVHANITPIRLLVARLDNTLHVYCTVQYSTGPTIRALQYVCLLIATSDRSSVHSRRFWTVASTFRTPADACQDPESGGARRGASLPCGWKAKYGIFPPLVKGCMASDIEGGKSGATLVTSPTPICYNQRWVKQRNQMSPSILRDSWDRHL
jgi:hypothetical protein